MDASVGEMERAVTIKLKDASEPHLQVNVKGQSMSATALPLTREARARAVRAGTIVRDGNTYQIDAQNRVEEMVDEAGNRSRYREVSKGAAGGVEITGKGGWRAFPQPLKSGSSLLLTTARGS